MKNKTNIGFLLTGETAYLPNVHTAVFSPSSPTSSGHVFAAGVGILADDCVHT